MSATYSERRRAAALGTALGLAVAVGPVLTDDAHAEDALTGDAAANGAGTTRAAAGARLIATPSTCVAMHRGQVCYRDIRLSWPALGAGRWCLERGDGSPLICWDGAALTAHEHAYASASAERYRLRRIADGSIVAGAEVRTAWVYRTSRRSASGWRLF